MLRLLDDRDGSYAEIKPARPGILRICAHPAGTSEGPGLNGLRVLLVADLLARTAELRGLQPLTVVVMAPGQSPDHVGAFENVADAIGIHPPGARADSHDPAASLSGPIDVHVASYDDGLRRDWAGLALRVGAAGMRRADREEAGAADVLKGSGGDPLAVRLALMSFACHEPASLTEGMLARAGETLKDWRRHVAEWAESPSRPIPAHIAKRVQAAFSGLDTVSALELLRGVAFDDSVPDGGKFETFVYADRILGLDLAREIGRSGV